MITSGTVVIEDGIKAAEEFAPARKVRVELSFDYDDLDRVAVIAQAKVSEMLGKSSGAAGKTAQATSSLDALKTATEAAAVGEAKKAPRKAATKPVETLPPVEDFPLGDETKAQSEGKADEASLEAGILGAEEPKVDVSDKALYDMVVAVNAKVKKPKDITVIITKYCPTDGVPPSLKRVPEASRVAFITEIKKFAADNAAK